jgi:hypothetical protein
VYGEMVEKTPPLDERSSSRRFISSGNISLLEFPKSTINFNHNLRRKQFMIDHGLNNKVVLVTGGNNPFGIGAAIANAVVFFASE